MSQNNKKLLKELKALDFSTCQTRLFFARRYLFNRQLSVTVYEPEITPDLAAKLGAAVKSRLAKANTVDKYAPLTTDVDDDILVAKATEVNWSAIQSRLSGNGRLSVKAAGTVEDLRNCEFYVAEFEFKDGRLLHAAKRLPQKLSIQRFKFDQWLFKGGKLDSLEDGRVFNVTLGVDFFSWGEQVFVVEKKSFESIMNIREGMVRKRDGLIAALQQLDKFHGLESLQESIGDNAHMLRRATQVSDSQNLSDPSFIKILFDVIEQHPSWGIALKGGKIVITPENSSDVLSLLNDARAESFIRRQVFDALVKKPVA